MADRDATDRGRPTGPGPRRFRGYRRDGQPASGPGPVDWGRIWFDKLARFHHVKEPSTWTFGREEVIEFLKHQKARGTPTWKRLRAVEALMEYQRSVRRVELPELADIRDTLQERASQERSGLTGDDEVEESPGLIDPKEPEVIQELRRALRVQHKAVKTERAYVGQVLAFMRKRRLSTLESFKKITASDVEAHLTELAVRDNVAESTQDQAYYALLFLFKYVLKRDMECIDAVRSTKPKRVPTVMSREEVSKVFSHLDGITLTMAKVLYGAGLRLSECLRLRVKDIDFDQMQIIVRRGKGKKDRITPFPKQLRATLKRLIEKRLWTHERDLEEGKASVWLPHALSVKYPNAHREFKWQYVFASERISRDPRNGNQHRHHIHKGTFPAHLARAVEQAGIQKQITSHTFRHSFATHLLSDGADIRTVQELLGHNDVKTTMIYLHVLNRQDVRVVSPLDRLLGPGDDSERSGGEPELRERLDRPEATRQDHDEEPETEEGTRDCQDVSQPHGEELNAREEEPVEKSGQGVSAVCIAADPIIESVAAEMDCVVLEREGACAEHDSSRVVEDDLSSGRFARMLKLVRNIRWHQWIPRVF